ncbi:hypothetical protein Goarm_010080 [Gossypium armourianum]|uniref:Uncharacterized protein n=1 Tax=Gossypium armourianum TaxID=34283 RepID=A0A7J9JUW7_9ROSI|nr:hypothetical protein [Gossypium armourianum]
MSITGMNTKKRVDVFALSVGYFPQSTRARR